MLPTIYNQVSIYRFLDCSFFIRQHNHYVQYFEASSYVVSTMWYKVYFNAGKFGFRLDVNNFRLSRAQKRVLRRMNDFLRNDIRPNERPKISEYNGAKRTTRSSAISSNSQIKKVEDDEKKILNHGFRKKGKKKKVLRQQRAFQKMRDKGISIKEVCIFFISYFFLL